jgi:hypothetical protein
MLERYRSWGREKSGVLGGYAAMKAAHLRDCAACRLFVARDGLESARLEAADRAFIRRFPAEVREALAVRYLADHPAFWKGIREQRRGKFDPDRH